jgi:hypothetical protein
LYLAKGSSGVNGERIMPEIIIDAPNKKDAELLAQAIQEQTGIKRDLIKLDIEDAYVLEDKQRSDLLDELEE